MNIKFTFLILVYAFSNNWNSMELNWEEIIIQTVLLDINLDDAFRYFSETEKLESWLTKKADVNPVKGGKYELFWDPERPYDNSTIGCKILAVKAPDYIIFDWKGPVQFKPFMNSADPLTVVSVYFVSRGDKTEVTLIHSGWRKEKEWQEARAYFVNAWNGAFRNLEQVANK